MPTFEASSQVASFEASFQVVSFGLERLSFALVEVGRAAGSFLLVRMVALLFLELSLLVEVVWVVVVVG